MCVRSSQGHRLLCLSMLVVACVALPSRDVSAEPQPRETWHALVAAGERYGSQHVTVTKRPDGNYLYVINSRTLLDLLGLQKQEMITNAKYIVTPDYQPVFVRVQRSTSTSETSIEGSTSSGKLRLDFSRGDLTWTRTIELTSDMVLSVCLDDLLNDFTARSEQDPVEVTLLNDEGWHVQPGTVAWQEVDDTDRVWSFDFGVEIGRGTVAFGPDGIRRETILRTPPLHMIRCTEAEAADLQHLALVGRDVLMFPLSKDIGRPDRLQSLNIRLTWKDVPLDRLDLEDARQHVIKQTDEAGQHDVLLAITVPEPIVDSLEFPIDDAEFAPYLAETRYIKPKDHDIERQARQWSQDSGDALAAVQVLSKEVSKLLGGGSLIQETLSGPEVLHLKEGKCSEFSTLFASLARSLGIPTRIILGERLTSSGWVGHMWNEAYVGEWITVDSTVNEVGSSLSLIKFVHSDTVMGTQEARYGLAGSLEIAVIDFERVESSLAATVKTGIEGLTYTNADFACRLTAPRDNWTLAEKPQAGAAIVQFKVPDDDVQIHFVMFQLPGTIDAQTLVAARQARFQGMYDQFKVLKNGEFAAGSTKGSTFVFERAGAGGGDDMMKTSEFLWTGAGAGYLLNLIASEQKHDAYLEEVEELLGSFKQLGTSP